MSQGFEGSARALPVLHHVNLKTTRLQEMIDWYTGKGCICTQFDSPGIIRSGCPSVALYFRGIEQ